MELLKRKSLVSFMVLCAVSIGCSDDDNDNETTTGESPATAGDGGGSDAGGELDAGGRADAGGAADAGGGDGGDGGAECKGTYAGFTAGDIQANAKSEGACITAAQVAQICTVDPVRQAAMAGATCFIALNKRGDALRTCTIEGDSSIDLQGINDVAPDLTNACMACYADAVVCAAAECVSECAADPESQDCDECRETQGCTPTFYTCSGLPSADEVK